MPVYKQNHGMRKLKIYLIVDSLIARAKRGVFLLEHGGRIEVLLSSYSHKQPVLAPFLQDKKDVITR